MNDGIWHSVAIIYDGADTVSLYIDKALVQAATSFTAVSGIPFSPIFYQTIGDNNKLGGKIHTQDNLFVGSLRNILFYDYAISEAEATSSPSTTPTAAPTAAPSTTPTTAPIEAPSTTPTDAPTAAPSTAKPNVINLSER